MSAPPATFTQVLHRHAAAQGEHTACVCLLDGEDEQTALSYAALDERARAIGARLQALGAAGERALLLFQPGLDYIAAFFGCLYAGVVAVPAYPPRNARGLPRIQAIVSDAQATLVLAADAEIGALQALAAQMPQLRGLRWLAADAVPAAEATMWTEPHTTGASIAFLQYTSGSTGEPKGVVLTHANLLHNSALISRNFEITAASAVMSWLPPYHDMGLIGGILQPLYAGIACHLMAPALFLQRPLRWLQAVSRLGATHSGGPDFAYDLCARRITAEQRKGLDLSRWRVAFSGAEPVRAATLERFTEAFADCGFRREAFLPCYGLAEATLLVTGRPGPRELRVQPRALEQSRLQPADDAGSQALVACGELADAPGVRIVDPQTHQPCAEGEVGEIWLSSASVAQGYWRRPELSTEVFGARLADGQGPWLRTGDLGAACDGRLYVTGRIKDLIILRGRNLYPTDIESAVQDSSPVLRRGFGVAFGVEASGEERLVVLQELEFRQKPDPEATRQAIVQAVAVAFEAVPHDVRLLKPGSLPVTSSGKLRRREARARYLAGEFGTVAPDAEGTAMTKPSAPFPPAAQSATAHGLAGWLAARIAPRAGLAPQDIDIDRPFTAFGLDSVETVELSGALEAHLGRRLSPTLLWDHPSIRSLTAHLEGGPQAGAHATASTATAEPVAVIGMACRLPGAPDLQAFWQLLRNGVDAITEVPTERWDGHALYAPEPGTPGMACSRWGGFIDDIDAFDADFFGISPSEAAAMDPQQRLLLETAWHALEHAGVAPGALASSATGVYVGIGSGDYARRLAGQLDAMDGHTGTGNSASIAANRISYQLGLQGPSMAVDTACSASLVAVHLACQGLRTRETDLALAGGVNALLEPDLYVAFSQAGMLAADGRCKTFDARADGYVRGEGCGMVVLKRLADAQRDGDPVLAVLAGSAVNQSGRSNGLTAPSRSAQRAVIQRALGLAGVQSQELGYVEAHGTGTALGDPIELQALAEALGEAPRAQPCAVGSVKTNIGHLEAAAGIAGLIKVVLMLRQRQLPPHLHIQQLNPRLRRKALPLEVNTRLQDWSPPAGMARVAGVSSFGFGGSNAHAVLREAPAPAPAPASATQPPLHLLTLSAHEPAALLELAQRWQQALAGLEPGALAQACHTARAGRSRLAERLVVLGRDADALCTALEAFLRTQPDPAWMHASVPGTAAPEVVWVLPGLSPAASVQPASLQALREALRGPGTAVPSAGSQAQPAEALLALQLELAALWRRWGLRPAAVLGVAEGEAAAKRCRTGLGEGPAGTSATRALWLELGPRAQPPELPPHARWLPGPVPHAPLWPELLRQLGRLWLEGVDVDWQAFGATQRLAGLPAYPFRRERHWATAARRPRRAGSAA